MEATRSRNELVRILSDVYRASAADELEPLTYLIQGRLAPFFEPLEIGLGQMLLITAIAMAYGAPKEEVIKLYRQAGDLGLTAQRLAPASHRESPSVVEVHQRLSQIAAAGGAGSMQKKLDGLRVQIHKEGGKVSIFSRNLESMTEMFPELVDAASGLKVQSVILDGEAIAYNPESEEYVPFQETTARRRKEGIQEFAARAPMRAFVFDVMFRDGSDLTPMHYEQRFEIVKELVRESDTLMTAPLMTTDSAEVLTRELLDNISRGLEGVVAKRLDSPYQAGARNFNWVKLKRNTSGQLTDTIDVVLLGYYRGKGKRAEFGAGALLAGVYDGDKDEFVTISKLGTGLSDQGWRAIHQRLASLEVAEKPARVNSTFVPDAWLEPAIVVEVLADEITPSPRHTAGMTGDGPGFALRFPRIVSLRTADKKPEDATSVREIREMFEQQRQPGRGRSG